MISPVLKKTLKYVGIGFLVLLTLLICWRVFLHYYLGFSPRHDYETEAPPLPEFSKPAVLVLNKTNGFIHRAAIPAADKMLTEIAQQQGWEIVITKNAAYHNLEDLNRFAVVVWNNVSGDVLTLEQRQALKQWMQQGGAWVGLHGTGGSTEYQWQWFVDTLIGTQFVGHTANPQFQDADVYVADEKLALTQHISSPWNIPQEEWYAFDSNPRDKGYEILLTVDESSYITHGEFMGRNDRMEGEHPIVWRHHIGEGRAFYSSIGHSADTYQNPAYRELITKALLWVKD